MWYTKRLNEGRQIIVHKRKAIFTSEHSDKRIKLNFCFLNEIFGENKSCIDFTFII